MPALLQHAAAARWLSAPVVVQQILPPRYEGERPEEPPWVCVETLQLVGLLLLRGMQQFVPASLSAGCAVLPFLWYCLGGGLPSFLLFLGGPHG